MRCARQSPGTLLILIVLSIAFFYSVGCGGGSQGTGVRSFEGVVIEQGTMLGLDGVTVTILETGDSEITQDGGHFSLEAALNGDSISFALDGPNGLSARTTGQGLPAVSNTFDVQISISSASNTAQVTRLEPRLSTPVPTQPAATGTATPAPTPTSSAPPTPSPSATATPVTMPTSASFSPVPCDLDIDGDFFITVVDLQLANNRYQSGDFDFNRDGATNATDINAYFALFNQYSESGSDCRTLGR